MNGNLLSLALGALVTLGLHAGPASADVTRTALATQPVNAVWIEHERNFTYFGQTTYYSCYALRDKVTYILEQVGAKPGFKVRVSCVESGGSGIETMPNVRIKAAFPAEATPALLDKLAAEAPKRELVAKVQGKEDDALAQFPAVWQKVEFEGWHDRRIDEGDCELLEQLVERVLVPMGARVAPDSRLGCMRNRVPVGSVQLRLETLQKAPEPDSPPAPAAG